MKKIFLVFLICFTFLNSGCDDAFNIVGEYEEQLVVFLILDNRFDKQIIKIQKLQNSYGIPTQEKLIDTLSVRIMDPSGYSKTFKDTVINSLHNFNTLCVDSLNLITGIYRLFISGEGSLYAWSNILIPQVPQLTTRFNSTDSCYYLYIKASRVTHTHVKPHLVYSIRQNSEFIEKSIEIPKAIDINKTDTVEFFHSMLEVPPDDPHIYNIYHLIVSSTSILYMKNKLINYYGKENVQFNHIKFLAYTYDQNLFDYINTNEGYSDTYSVRLDKSNYTNVIGGVGIFGSILADSIEIRLN